jgi:hypothetical protein
MKIEVLLEDVGVKENGAKTQAIVKYSPSCSKEIVDQVF